MLSLLVAVAVAGDPHKDALPDGVPWKRYKHVRMVRTGFGKGRVKPARMPLHRDGVARDPFAHNPSNAGMFRAPGGGLTRIKNLTVKKWSHIPGTVKSYRRPYSVPDVGGSRDMATHYVYPLGTKFAETISYKGKVFEVRTSEKVGQKEWSFDQRELGKKPPGYRQVGDCRVCHRQAGADGLTMPKIGRRTWWGYGRAPGDDHVISFDPQQARKRLRIRRVGGRWPIRGRRSNMRLVR